MQYVRKGIYCYSQIDKCYYCACSAYTCTTMDKSPLILLNILYYCIYQCLNYSIVLISWLTVVWPVSPLQLNYILYLVLITIVFIILTRINIICITTTFFTIILYFTLNVIWLLLLLLIYALLFFFLGSLVLSILVVIVAVNIGVSCIV